jgi:hypothetical protein
MDPLTMAALYGGSELISGIGGYFGNEAKREAAREAARIKNQAFDESRALGEGYYDDLLGMLGGIEADYGKEASTYDQDLGLWRRAMMQKRPEMGAFDESQFDVNKFLDPSMAFQQKAMSDAVQQSAAGQGSLMSGATLKALQENAAGLASQDYGNAFNRSLAARDRGYGAYMDRFKASTDAADQMMENLGALARQSGAARQSQYGVKQNMYDAKGARTNLGMNTLLSKAGVNADRATNSGNINAANWQLGADAVGAGLGAATKYYGGR